MVEFLSVIMVLSIPVFVGILIALLIKLSRKKPVKKTAIALGVTFVVGFFSMVLAMILVFTGHGGELSDAVDSYNAGEGNHGSNEEKTIEEVNAPEVQTVTEKPAEESAQTASETPKPETQTSDESNDAYFTANTDASAPADIDTRIADLMVEKGYSIEHATAIQQILNTIGIESLEIENMTGEAEKGLNSVVSFPNGYTDRDRRFYFTTEDGVLFYAGFLDEDLYDSENGGYLKNYNDVHVPEKEVTWDDLYALEALAEPAVKECLNYPNTANFDGFAYRIGRSDDNYQLLGDVTAKNGFGVKDTIHFSVWFVKDGGSFRIEAIAFNGIRVK